MYRFCFKSACLLLTLWAASSYAFIKTQGKHFVNEQGAKVIFRGFNLQAKAPPFQPIKSASELDPLAELGVNLLRFNFIWEAAEPEPGQYDESYFEYYDRVVNWAWERGIYILIDFHNNAFSRYAANGCGSGFPYWAISPDAKVWQPKPNGECTFNTFMAGAMLSSDNYANWSDFMLDTHGVRTRFFELTRRLAEKYADHPAVIGFDLNEPMVFKPIMRYDSELTNHFFNEWHQFIQSINRRYITFFGDNPLQFVLLNKVPHLEIPEGGQVSLDAHFYEPGGHSLGSPILSTTPSIRAIVATRDTYEIPVLIGEYGVKITGNTKERLQYQMDMALRLMDKELMSSARWNFTPHWNPVDKDFYHDEDYSCFDENSLLRPSCAPRANLQQLSGELIDIAIHHKGEAKFFIPMLPFLSDWFQFKDTVIDIRWQHVPQQGGTKIYASRSIIFADTDVEILTEGDDLDCHFDQQEKYVHCDSSTAGEKRVLIREAATAAD